MGSLPLRSLLLASQGCLEPDLAKGVGQTDDLGSDLLDPCAGTLESAVPLGHAQEAVNLPAGESQSSRLFSASIGQDGGGVELAMDAVAVGMAAAAADRIDVASPERLGAGEDLDEPSHLRGELTELMAEYRGIARFMHAACLNNIQKAACLD
jgi:hypothetical protein